MGVGEDRKRQIKHAIAQAFPQRPLRTHGASESCVAPGHVEYSEFLGVLIV